MSEVVEATTELLIVGLGEIGCDLAARCNVPGATKRFVLFEPPALASFPDDQTLSLGGDGERTDEMDPEAMRLAGQRAGQRLTSDAASLAFLFVAAGGQTASVVAPAIVSELRAAGSTTLAIVLDPLPFEGALRAEMAAEAHGELEVVADIVLNLPNRPVAEICDPELPVAEALEELKGKVAEAVGQLAVALTCSSCVGLRPAELRASLADAGRAALGVGHGEGERRVEKAIRDACANSFLTQEACQRASAALLHLFGGTDVSLNEIHGAAELVTQLVGRVPIQVGLTTLPDETGVRATLLVTGIRPQEISPRGFDQIGAGGDDELSFYDGVNLEVPAYMRRRPLSRPRA